MIFGGIFHDYFEQPWEVAASFVREEFEQLYTTLSANWNRAFTTDGELNPDAIAGDSSIDVVYVSNEGPNHSPKWAKVNLQNGVKGRNLFSHMQQIGPGTILGVPTDTTTQDLEELTLGDGLEMNGNVLSATSMGGAVIPLASGAEPLTFISDGAGNPILVEYEL